MSTDRQSKKLPSQTIASSYFRMMQLLFFYSIYKETVIVAVELQTQSTRINRDISTEDVDKIKKANSVNDVSSIWSKIADLICGTNKEEAKAILFRLLHEKNVYGADNCQARLDDFHALKAMVLKHAQSYFRESETGFHKTYIMLSIKDPARQLYHRASLLSAVALHDLSPDDIASKNAVIEDENTYEEMYKRNIAYISYRMVQPVKWYNESGQLNRRNISVS